MDAKNDNIPYRKLEICAKKMLFIWINVFWNVYGKKFGRNAALSLVLLRHYTGGQLQRSS